MQAPYCGTGPRGPSAAGASGSGRNNDERADPDPEQQAQQERSSGPAFARRLAVLLLVNGRDLIAALVRALRRGAAAALLWARRSAGPLLASPAAAARVLAAVVRAALRSAPVQALVMLLARLVSLRVVVAANDDRSGGARLSARMGSQLALLFGCVRLNTNTCVQLAPPSMQPLPPLGRLERAGTSSSGGAPASAAGADHVAICCAPASGAAAGAQLAEGLHLRCSGELKAAILRFLSDQGERYLVMPPPGAWPGSEAGSLRASLAVAAAALAPAAADGAAGVGEQAASPEAAEQPPSPDPREPAGPRAAACAGPPSVESPCADTPTVLLAAARSVRESCELFEGLGSLRLREAGASTSAADTPPRAGSPLARVQAAAPAAAAAAAPPAAARGAAPTPAEVAALYACAAPAGRISPIAHPAKHGMNPRAPGLAGAAAAGAAAAAAPAASAPAGAPPRPKVLPAVPFAAPFASRGPPSPAAAGKGPPSPGAAAAGPPSARSQGSSPGSGGLRALLAGGGGAEPLFNGGLAAARQGGARQ